PASGPGRVGSSNTPWIPGHHLRGSLSCGLRHPAARVEDRACDEHVKAEVRARLGILRPSMPDDSRRIRLPRGGSYLEERQDEEGQSPLLRLRTTIPKNGQGPL